MMYHRSNLRLTPCILLVREVDQHNVRCLLLAALSLKAPIPLSRLLMSREFYGLLLLSKVGQGDAAWSVGFKHILPGAMEVLGGKLGLDNTICPGQ